MGQKDKTEKLFVACADIFAELVNVLVYQGEKPWKAARTVRDLIDYRVPEMAEDYLDKNRIHVFDMRFLDKGVREKMEGEKRVIC